MSAPSDIKSLALALGFDDCRFAPAVEAPHAPAFHRWLEAGSHGGMGYLARNPEDRTDPRRLVPGARTVIVLAASYHHDISQPSTLNPQLSPRLLTPALSSVEEERVPVGEPGSGPVSQLSALNSQLSPISRYAWFADYHPVLGERLERLAAQVMAAGGQGTVCRAFVDAGPLLERDFAQLAGLGFAGKHTNLISRRWGNWFFLAAMVTTLEIEPDPPETNHCGACVRCLKACPTGALTGPFQLEARRCLSYLTIENKGPIPEEFRPALGGRIFGCDTCLEVCPWNRFAHEGHLMRAQLRPDLRQPDLIELLGLDAAAFKKRFAGTSLERAKRRGLLRNICVALGNTGDASCLPALQRAAADAEPLIAEHAQWALRRLQAPASRSGMPDGHAPVGGVTA